MACPDLDRCYESAVCLWQGRSQCGNLCASFLAFCGDLGLVCVACDQAHAERAWWHSGELDSLQQRDTADGHPFGHQDVAISEEDGVVGVDKLARDEVAPGMVA